MENTQVSVLSFLLLWNETATSEATEEERIMFSTFSTYTTEILHTLQKSGWEFPDNSPD